MTSEQEGHLELRFCFSYSSALTKLTQNYAVEWLSYLGMLAQVVLLILAVIECSTTLKKKPENKKPWLTSSSKSHFSRNISNVVFVALPPIVFQQPLF